MAKPYNIVRDISTQRSGQWLGSAYIVKANPREVFGDVIFVAGGRAAGGDFTDRTTIDPKEGK
jgi:hypothetical protein